MIMEVSNKDMLTRDGRLWLDGGGDRFYREKDEKWKEKREKKCKTYLCQLMYQPCLETFSST